MSRKVNKISLYSNGCLLRKHFKKMLKFIIGNVNKCKTIPSSSSSNLSTICSSFRSHPSKYCSYASSLIPHHFISTLPPSPSVFSSNSSSTTSRTILSCNSSSTVLTASKGLGSYSCVHGHGYKTKSALKLRCEHCFFARRRGKLRVICKENPKHKQVQI